MTRVKNSRKSRQSRGLIGSPKGVRTSTGMQRLLNQQKAWDMGKRVMLLIPGMDKPVEARGVWGLPKHLRKNEK